MDSDFLHQWSDIGCISNPNIPRLPRVLLVVMNVFLITISSCGLRGHLVWADTWSLRYIKRMHRALGLRRPMLYCERLNSQVTQSAHSANNSTAAE